MPESYPRKILVWATNGCLSAVRKPLILCKLGGVEFQGVTRLSRAGLTRAVKIQIWPSGIMA